MAPARCALALSSLMLAAPACVPPQGSIDDGAMPLPEQPDEVLSPRSRRVPAEWEPQAAVWMQWPQVWEASFEPAFVQIVAAARQHQPVRLLAADSDVERDGRSALQQAGVPTAGVTWHVIANDSAWMRDNGPRYVEFDGQRVLQDWGFDAWGGNFGPHIPFEADDAVPLAIASILDLEVETVPIIHERGDLEFNGLDTVIVSWSVLSDRNPQLSREQAREWMTAAFGVDSVVFIEGYHPDDPTTGHTDGLARFVSQDEVVVGQIRDAQDDPVSATLYDDVAEQIAAQRPDLTVRRLEFPAGTNYMNWLVGNGFVISGGFGDPQVDDEVRVRIEAFFPGRTVYMVDIDALWAAGGGVHCVTNDEPAPPPA